MKKIILRIIIIVCLMSVPAYNFGSTLLKQNTPKESVNVDVSGIREIEKVSPASVQKIINEKNKVRKEEQKAEEERVQKEKRIESRDEGIASILNKIQSGETNLNQLFNGTLIAGDSLIEAITYFNVLSKDSVMGVVSASLYKLQSSSPTIIRYQPGVLILHYGQNHVGDSSPEMVRRYTSLYSKLIKNFQEKIPDTRIVVSSIFPANEHGLTKEPYLANIPMYNEALGKMCEELGVEFLDNSPMFLGETPFYEPDGVHMKKVFYTDYWLPFVVYELELL